VLISAGIAIGLLFGVAWWVIADRQPGRRTVSAAPSRDALAFQTPLPVASSAPAGSPALTADPVASPPPLPAPSGSEPPPAPLPGSHRPPGPGRPQAPSGTRPAEAKAPPVKVTARYATRTVWDNGFVADVVVVNVSAEPQPFAVRLTMPPGVKVTNQVWNATADGGTGPVTFRGEPLAPGQRVTFGFVADKDPALTDRRRFEPTSCTVNGHACA
jgi:hypothetical protein